MTDLIGRPLGGKTDYSPTAGGQQQASASPKESAWQLRQAYGLTLSAGGRGPKDRTRPEKSPQQGRLHGGEHRSSSKDLSSSSLGMSYTKSSSEFQAAVAVDDAVRTVVERIGVSTIPPVERLSKERDRFLGALVVDEASQHATQRAGVLPPEKLTRELDVALAAVAVDSANKRVTEKLGIRRPEKVASKKPARAVVSCPKAGKSRSPSPVRIGVQQSPRRTGARRQQSWGKSKSRGRSPPPGRGRGILTPRSSNRTSANNTARMTSGTASKFFCSDENNTTFHDTNASRSEVEVLDLDIGAALRREGRGAGGGLGGSSGTASQQDQAPHSESGLSQTSKKSTGSRMHVRGVGTSLRSEGSHMAMNDHHGGGGSSLGDVAGGPYANKTEKYRSWMQNYLG